MNNKFLIWDLPTRAFHWLFTVGFIVAALIAFLTGGESRLFPYHALIGLVILLMVVCRGVWGLIGTQYARFSSFCFGPSTVLIYLKETFGGDGTRHIGHNPGSAYAIFAMLALLLGISFTGILLARGESTFKDAHEWMSLAMIAVAVAHVIGVISHTIRHRENITLSMVNGKKVCPPYYAIASARPIAAAMFLAFLSLWTVGLIQNYDSATSTVTLPIVRMSLQLGEHENETPQSHPGRQERMHDD